VLAESVATVLATLAAVVPGGGAGIAQQSGCPTIVDQRAFAGAQQLRRLTGTVAGFGLRSTASAAHKRTIDWLERQMRAIDGVRVRSESFGLRRWQPLPRARKAPGRDLARAGALALLRGQRAPRAIPVAGAIPYAKPGRRAGRLVYLSADQEITARNSRGRVIVRDLPPHSIPFAAFQAVSWFTTGDTPADGDYERPYLAPIHEDLIAAGRAGAAGMVMAFDVPQRQVRGYFDPHNGTHYRLPAVFVGREQGRHVKRLASRGRSASVVVRAEADRARTRNLIATLPGRTPERIVLSVNTDGNTWVQENGNAGVVALARYLASLPRACRSKTVEFAFGSAHLHISREGTDRHAEQLDGEYDEGTVAFAFAIEHLGTREILPGGPRNTLRLTGNGELFAWFAGPSPALVDTARAAIERRRLDRTALLKGADAPVGDRAPANCSFGGIGTPFHNRLIPTMAVISGPWSLWAPVFGERAIDFARMRRQLLAVGDTLLSLDDVSREEIAGAYLSERERRRAGTPTCPDELPPEQAPGPAAGGAAAAIAQPPQPRSGPGGRGYSHAGWRVSAGGSGADAWHVFEPVRPRPAKAPLAILMHGYGEFSGYEQMYELIRHTVRKGSIVVYPRWQTGIAAPCPGPFDIEPCIRSAVNGIRGALSYLRARPQRVRPQPGGASYLGFSFGAIVTANLANRHRSLHVPKPRALFLEDPHDGGLTGFDEPALDDSLSGIPRTAKLQCHSSAEGVISEPSKANGGCNAIFPKLAHIPAANKDLVLTHPDTHGDPDLSSAHGVCTARKGAADAYDWNFCWKVWDALRDCADGGTNCRYALGNTPRHRSNGRWSDGVPIAPLLIRDAAPIRP
jgi:hypothetical protein